MKREQSTTTLGIFFFSIAIMLSGTVFAADTTPRRVTQPEFDAAIIAVNSKISDITPPVRAIGDVLSDNSIVFWIDETGQHGLAAQPFDNAPPNMWWEAKEAAEDHGPGWRLPTKHELNLLYLQREVVGGFAADYYWSTTENGPSIAYVQHFVNGNVANDNPKNYAFISRAVRAF